MVRPGGLMLAIGYGAAVAWLYWAQPQTVGEVAGALSSSVGAYQVDQRAMEDGLAFFRRDQFEEARTAFGRADPARRDATTQFYVAYSYYRQGWGRLYSDDALFAQGLEAVDRAIALAPGHRLVVADPDLGMQSADELKAELQRGMRREWSDVDPRRIFRSRK